MDVRIKSFSTRSVTPIELENGSIRRWTFIDEAGTGRKTRFDLGVSTLKAGVETSILGDSREERLEKLCLVTRGEIDVIQGTRKDRLGPLDSLSAPPGSRYLISAPEGEATFIWVTAPSLSGLIESRHSYVGTPRIVRARELKPTDASTEPPNRFTTYPILRGANFIFGFVKRPSGAHGFLHTHDPQDCEEAFISVKGSVQINDTTGASHVLEPYDAVYVPPFGGNMNRNVGPDECIYAYVNSPAVDIKDIPVGPVTE
jgi:hypothetical protein